jgi:hypothetical protein
MSLKVDLSTSFKYLTGTVKFSLIIECATQNVFILMNKYIYFIKCRKLKHKQSFELTYFFL